MAELITDKLIKSILPVRVQDSHKYTFGRVLNVAGCEMYTGAAYLSSISALKAGAGFVRLASSESVIKIIASMAPEITYQSVSEEFAVDEYDVISIGCGLGRSSKAAQLMKSVLSKIQENQKLVIDADGINILADNNFEFDLKNAVLTPHEMELSRLLKVDLTQIKENREKYARIAAQKYDCTVVLKGHKTIVTGGDRLLINSTGNSSLAKAGSGDVLTGIISAMLAQGASLFDAALLGVYIHGLAGDIASTDLTQYCVLATDVIDYIPFAFNQILMEEQGF